MEIYFLKIWKGSESAIINPIKMYGKDLAFYYVGLIILKIFQIRFQFIQNL